MNIQKAINLYEDLSEISYLNNQNNFAYHIKNIALITIDNYQNVQMIVNVCTSHGILLFNCNTISDVIFCMEKVITSNLNNIRNIEYKNISNEIKEKFVKRLFGLN